MRIVQHALNRLGVVRIGIGIFNLERLVVHHHAGKPAERRRLHALRLKAEELGNLRRAIRGELAAAFLAVRQDPRVLNDLDLLALPVEHLSREPVVRRVEHDVQGSKNRSSAQSAATPLRTK